MKKFDIEKFTLLLFNIIFLIFIINISFCNTFLFIAILVFYFMCSYTIIKFTTFLEERKMNMNLEEIKELIHDFEGVFGRVVWQGGCFKALDLDILGLPVEELEKGYKALYELNNVVNDFSKKYNNEYNNLLVYLSKYFKSEGDLKMNYKFYCYECFKEVLIINVPKIEKSEIIERCRRKFAPNSVCLNNVKLKRVIDENELNYLKEVNDVYEFDDLK